MNSKLMMRPRSAVLVLAFLSVSMAQQMSAQTMNRTVSSDAHAHKPALKMSDMGNQVFAHILFDQLDGRIDSADSQFRWNGEGWVGTDTNRLWGKTEGFAANGAVSDGDQEVLYDRPIPRLRYFDAQVGVRADLDSGPRRMWGAVGIEGLAPYFFEFAPTLYFRDGGNVAGRIEGNYDLRITQRLVAQPEVEMNFYNKDDPRRGVGSGLSEVDTGLRLRYEFNRKLAPYIGFAYNGSFADTAAYQRRSGERTQSSRFVCGIRVWY